MTNVCLPTHHGKGGTNSLAPGALGVLWEILKMAWPIIKYHFLKLANACIITGHDPIKWHKALVVIIPKP